MAESMLDWLILVTSLAAALAGWLWLRVRSQQMRTERQLEGCRLGAVEAQQRTAALEDRFSDVLEHCGTAVLGLDRDLNVFLSNTLARDMLGHDLQGRPLIQAVLSDELQAEVRRSFEEGKPAQLELQGVGTGNLTLLAEIYPRPESSEVFVFLQDVTEVRRLETVRRDFVANVSHELRTPLASIRAMAETLESGALEETKTARRFLGTIVSESDRLARIAEDLLTLSRAESVEPVRERFDLTLLLDEMVARFSATAKKQKVGLEAAIPRDLELVASREQVDEAVTNLVDNALKYTSEGGQVSISATKEDGSIAISVSDNGIGILQEDIHRIFERFYRVDKARSRLTGGTGLGLSIVKHVAESHGGSVRVESEFNRGSTFTLLLPVSFGVQE